MPRARDTAWAWGLRRGPLPSPSCWGPGGCGEKAESTQVPRKGRGGWCLRGEGGKKMGSESGKEVGVPGLRGPVPVLRSGPPRGVASGRAAPRLPPARSARGPRPEAPAAPRTRRAALVTGGGGRGDPGGLGVGRLGGREEGVRPAAPALDVSLLSISHLMRRQTDQHPRSWTATLPAGIWVLAPLGSFPSVATHGCPNLCLDPLPSHPPTTHQRSCSWLSPSPTLTAFLQAMPASANPPAPSQDRRSTPLPLASSGTLTTSVGTGGCHRFQMKGTGAHAQVPLASHQRRPGGMSAPAGRRSGPGCPRTGSGRQRAASRALPLPQLGPGPRHPSTCSSRAHLGLRPPAAPRWVAWGGTGWERRGGRERRAGEGRGRRAAARGGRPAPRRRAGEKGARALDADPAGRGGSAPSRAAGSA